MPVISGLGTRPFRLSGGFGRGLLRIHRGAAEIAQDAEQGRHHQQHQQGGGEQTEDDAGGQRHQDLCLQTLLQQ